MTTTETTIDWYARRDELRVGQTFTTIDGYTVMLDRDVPGDATKWYVLDWCNGSWIADDSTIEPSDLLEQVAA